MSANVPIEETPLKDRLSAWADIGLSVLAVVMLVLLIVEFAEVTPKSYADDLVRASTAIWAIFVVAFVAELWTAESKVRYLRRNWLAALSLAIPFLRVFRIARAIRLLRATRAVRGLALGRTIGALNRVRRVLLDFAATSQLAYLVLLTVLVSVTAAAAVFFFERDAEDAQIGTFGDALWWAATMITTVNIGAEPVTFEGRIAAFLLRIFGVAVFGYITARLAVFFLGRDHQAAANAAPAPPRDEDLAALGEEVRRLRMTIEARQDADR